MWNSSGMVYGQQRSRRFGGWKVLQSTPHQSSRPIIGRQFGTISRVRFEIPGPKSKARSKVFPYLKGPMHSASELKTPAAVLFGSGISRAVPWYHTCMWGNNLALGLWILFINFVWVILRTTKGVVPTPYGFFDVIIFASGIKFWLSGSCWGSISAHLDV